MDEKTGPSIGSRLIAALILAVGAYILLKVVIGIVVGIAYTVVVIIAIVGIIWALRTLL